MVIEIVRLKMTKNKLLLGSLLLGLMLALSGCSADTREALTKKVVDTLIDKSDVLLKYLD